MSLKYSGVIIFFKILILGLLFGKGILSFINSGRLVPLVIKDGGMPTFGYHLVVIQTLCIQHIQHYCFALNAIQSAKVFKFRILSYVTRIARYLFEKWFFNYAVV